MTRDACLLVDGYNVINSWKDFEQLKKIDLEHARDRLVDVLSNYAAFKGCFVTVVFDAYVATGVASISERSGVEVVFTAEGETADSYIEKIAYNLVRQGKKVFVVTGDYLEQLMALGVGAYRLTAKELYKDCLQVKMSIAERVSGGRPLAGRHELAGRLDEQMMQMLERLRRNN